MTAKLQVINTMLALLGEEPYASLEVDPIPPKLAKALRLIEGLAGVVDWTLRRHPWLCAMRYETLEASARAGGWKYPYQVELPATCLRVWEVDGCDAYEVGTDVVDGAAIKVVRSAAAGSLNVAFTDRKPLDALTPDVLTAIAYELAARGAGPIQEKPDKAPAFHRTALEMMGLGQGAEAGEHGGEDPLMVGSFEALRRSAG